ncbi:MAG: metallophosphoesterase [Magnetovibrionaceae bacterium]
MMEASGLYQSPERTKLPRRDDLFHRAMACFGRGVEMVGLGNRGRANALDLQDRQLTITSSVLPEAFEGYRILHLTDLHLDALPGLGDRLAEQLKGREVDLCVMTGDYRMGDDGPFEQIMEPMAKILDAVKARDGVVATLGNHDDHRMGEAFEARLGIRLLCNERHVLRRGGGALSITGTDDVNRFYSTDADAALKPPVEGFGLALVHSPELAQEAAEAGHHLYLCGHTHGGQICLPGGRPLVTHLTRNKDLARGLWQLGGMQGYTSPGAGTSGLPYRFFSRGEVTTIDLKRG